MNANELPADQLADLLDEIPVGDFESLDHHHFTRQAATMLRQQQAEIEALKQIIDANNLNQNIGQFVKAANEPVALTQADILGILQDANSVPLGQPIFNSSEEYNKLKAIIESAIRYTHPVKELHLSLQKSKETGELLAVTYTDDEHRIVEVLWQKPPVKEQLTDDEIEECCCFLDVGLHHRYEPNAVVKDIEWTVTGIKDFVEAILRKAQENGNV